MVAEIKRKLRTPKGHLFLVIIISLFGFMGWFTIQKAMSAQSVDKDIREIVLEIRNGTFGENNPTIYLNAREQVRFVIYNLEPGIKHNFSIPGTEIRTRLLEYKETASVMFYPPDVRQWIYQCDPHALWMNGRLIVTKNPS